MCHWAIGHHSCSHMSCHKCGWAGHTCSVELHIFCTAGCLNQQHYVALVAAARNLAAQLFCNPSTAYHRSFKHCMCHAHRPNIRVKWPLSLRNDTLECKE